MANGELSLGALEAQALAVAILLVVSDRNQGPDCASQAMTFDFTGAKFHFVDAQLPPQYFAAIRAARDAIRAIMDAPSLPNTT